MKFTKQLRASHAKPSYIYKIVNTLMMRGVGEAPGFVLAKMQHL